MRTVASTKGPPLLTSQMTRSPRCHGSALRGQVGAGVRGAPGREVRFRVRADGLKQARRFRSCRDQDARLRAEPKTELKLIPDVLRQREFRKLVDPSSIMFRTAELFG